MEEVHGKVRDLEDMPDSRTTRPALVVAPQAPKRQLVPYNAKLMMRRDPLPPVFTSPADLTDVPAGTVGRDNLVIKG